MYQNKSFRRLLEPQSFAIDELEYECENNLEERRI